AAGSRRRGLARRARRGGAAAHAGQPGDAPGALAAGASGGARARAAVPGAAGRLRQLRDRARRVRAGARVGSGLELRAARAAGGVRMRRAWACVGVAGVVFGGLAHLDVLPPELAAGLTVVSTVALALLAHGGGSLATEAVALGAGGALAYEASRPYL